MEPKVSEQIIIELPRLVITSDMAEELYLDEEAVQEEFFTTFSTGPGVVEQASEKDRKAVFSLYAEVLHREDRRDRAEKALKQIIEGYDRQILHLRQAGEALLGNIEGQQS